MNGEMIEYNIIDKKSGTPVLKKQRGEEYKGFFGIQIESTLTKSICFRITHIPTGYLLTRLYFITSKDAKKYIDWLTDGIIEAFNSSNVTQIHQALADTEKIVKQGGFEKKFGDKALKFGS